MLLAALVFVVLVIVLVDLVDFVLGVLGIFGLLDGLLGVLLCLDVGLLGALLVVAGILPAVFAFLLTLLDLLVFFRRLALLLNCRSDSGGDGLGRRRRRRGPGPCCELLWNFETPVAADEGCGWA